MLKNLEFISIAYSDKKGNWKIADKKLAKLMDKNKIYVTTINLDTNSITLWEGV